MIADYELRTKADRFVYRAIVKDSAYPFTIHYRSPETYGSREAAKAAAQAHLEQMQERPTQEATA